MMNQMIEKLFEDIPYSESMDEVKTRIKNKLQQEYEKERENYNELQAAGRILEQ